MNSYFARQPILDEHLELFGYELLFRPDPQANTSGQNIILDGDNATSSVLNAVDWTGIANATGGTQAFINFTEQLLLSGVPTLYPKEHLVVEVLETVRMNPQILRAIQDLKEKGYTIALDDYEYRSNDQHLFSLCDIIKVEMDGSAKAYENLQRVVDALPPGQCRILAEKVETQQDFEESKALGCTLFQGYFFAKPKVVEEKTITPLKMNQMRLLRELTSPGGVEFSKLANIIKYDVALSAKTLRLVNSAHYALPHEVKSISQALTLLGIDELYKWLNYTFLAGLSADKPSELIVLSMTRAHFCEQVAKKIKGPHMADAYFLAGMFSLLDTMTNCNLQDCLKQMQIPQVTKAALLESGNDGRLALDLIIAIENGNWKNTSRLCQALGLTDGMALQFYINAMKETQRFYDAGKLDDEAE